MPYKDLAKYREWHRENERKLYAPTRIANEEKRRQDFIDRFPNWEECIKHFSEEDRELLLNIYGLDGRAAISLAEVARQRGVSREAIRQRREKVLRDLTALHKD